jgi:CheY-like chemotaxis protein
MAEQPHTRGRSLKLAILNDSHQVLKLLCDWFQECGHDCSTAVVADMPEAYTQVAQFILSVNPDVIVYDVALPYLSSWDFLGVIREMPSMKVHKFVITTPNKKELDHAVSQRTSALELTGRRSDMERLLKAVQKTAEQES